MPGTEITSREYKLLLSTTRFRKRGAVSREWLELADRAIRRAGGVRLDQGEVEDEKTRKKSEEPEKRDKPLECEEKHRVTSFLDTADDAFRNRNWILRVRRKEKEQVDLTLKFRCPDRLVSALQDAGSPEKSDPKFEEDVVPPFSSQYSRSNTLKNRDESVIPKSVRDAAKLFPALGRLGLPEDLPLVTVGELVVNEIARRVGGFQFGKGPILEMSHTFWYVGETEGRFPMVAEFSFEFQSENGVFDIATVEGASKVYRELQQQAGWLDVAGTTKSALVAGGV